MNLLYCLPYHQRRLDIMPVKASDNSNQDCSYRGIEYRLCSGTQYKAMLLHGLIGTCLYVWNVILNQINKEVGDQDTENPSTSFIRYLNDTQSCARKRVGYLRTHLLLFVIH